jgi:hypothetical protein
VTDISSKTDGRSYHFLIKCLSLEQTRQPFIDKIKALLNTVDKELYKSIYKNDIELTQLKGKIKFNCIHFLFLKGIILFNIHIELVMTGALRIPMSIKMTLDSLS